MADDRDTNISDAQNRPNAVLTAYQDYKIQKVAAGGKPFTLKLQHALVCRMLAECGLPAPQKGFFHTIFGVPLEIVD